MPQKTTPIPTKFCNNCKQYKPITSFGINLTKYDGLQTYCKPCQSHYASQCRKNKKSRDSKEAGINIQTKICPKCQQHKPTTDFALDISKKDGLQTYCRSCQSIRLKQSRKNKTKSILTTTPPSIPEFKGSSVTKRNFNDISQVYIDKYIGEIKNEKNDNIIKQPTVSNPSLNDLILEAKVKLTILTHLKEVGES